MYPLILALVTDEEEFEKLLSKIPDKYNFCKNFPAPGTGVTLTFDSPISGILVLIGLGKTSNSSDEQVISILTHEAVHVWRAVQKAMHIKKPDNETEAYAIQFYARYLVKEYFYRKNKPTKK